VGPSAFAFASASTSMARTVSSRLLAPSTVGASPSVQPGNVLPTSFTSARCNCLSQSTKCDVLHDDSKAVSNASNTITPNARQMMTLTKSNVTPKVAPNASLSMKNVTEIGFEEEMTCHYGHQRQ